MNKTLENLGLQFVPFDELKARRKNVNKNYYLAYEKKYGDYTLFTHIYAITYYENFAPDESLKYPNKLCCFGFVKNNDDGTATDSEEYLTNNINIGFSRNGITAFYKSSPIKFFDSVKCKELISIIEKLDKHFGVSAQKAISKDPVKCRRCGCFDEYAAPDSDGKCLCWRCCG